MFERVLMIAVLCTLFYFLLQKLCEKNLKSRYNSIYTTLLLSTLQKYRQVNQIAKK